MKRLPQDWQRAFESGVTHLCHLWLIERRDGECLGLTDHDRALEIDGVTYHAADGMSLSALDMAGSLERAHPQVEGVLGSPHLKAADLRRGLYDAARFSLSLIDWQNTENRLLLISGTFGPVQLQDGRFRVTLRLQGDGLQDVRGRLYQRDCDAALGDARCGFQLNDTPFVWRAALIGHTRQQIILPSFAQPTGWFTYGDVQYGAAPPWLIRDDTIGHADFGQNVRVLTLWQEISPPLDIGEQVVVRAGCDKALSTCHAKFANQLNYQGFPDLSDDTLLIHLGPQQNG